MDDLGRSASDTLRGYEYQLYRSVLDWLSLPIGERLFLERAEDLLTIGDSGEQHQQIRDVAAPVSLNQQKTLRSLDHFWAYQNSVTRVNFRYITTGDIGIEQGHPFGPGVKGVVLWQQARLLGAVEAQAATEQIRTYLLKKGKIGGALRAALETRSAQDLHRELIVPFDWVTNAPGTDLIRCQAHDLVIQIAADPQYRIPAQEADTILNTLVTEVLRVAAREPTECLTRGTLHDILSNQALRLVHPNDFRDMMAAVATEIVAQTGGKSIETSVLTAPPPVPMQYTRRERLYDAVISALEQRSFCFITGSVGTGKSTLAKDVARTSNRSWSWLALRGLSGIAAADRIDRAWRETLDKRSATNVVLDDINIDENVGAVVDSVARLLATLRSQDASLVVTSSHDMPTRLEAFFGAETGAVKVGNFAEADILALLLAFGASAERIPELLTVVQRRSFGGHPTLVMAHIAALKRLQWNTEVSEKQARSEVANVYVEIRRLVNSLEREERLFLYRLSLALVSLSRKQVVHVASLAPRIEEPGLILDRLTGPWLEIDATGSIRKTPLIAGLSDEVLDRQNVVAIHSGIADALLVEHSLRLEDVVGVLWHGIHGENEDAIGFLLAALLQQGDNVIRSAARSTEFFVAWRTEGNATLPVSRPEVRLIVRMAQVRMATLLENDSLVKAVIEAAEREMPDAGKMKRNRFFFDSYVLAFGRLSIESTTKRALVWAEGANREPAFASMRKAHRGRVSRSAVSSVLEFAASMVLGRIRNSDDLRAMLDALSTAPDVVQREFLEWLGETRFMLRGMFGHLEVAEFDRAQPRWQDVVAAVQHLYQVSINLSLIQIARLCASEIVKISAGPLNNPTEALEQLTKVEQQIGRDALSVCARAHALFLAKDYAGALELWRSALPQLQGEPSDLQPSEDARYAAMAASTLRKYEDARDWLIWARERLSEEHFSLSRAVLAVDAAFACWKASDNNEACRLLRIGIRELRNMHNPSDPMQFASLKRVGQVVSWISAPNRDDLRAMEYVVPDIGMASRLDTITDQRVRATPLSYIAASACDLEFRVNGDGSMYDEFREIFDTDPTPEVAYKASLLRAGWSVRRREGHVPAALGAIVEERARVCEALGKPMPTADRDIFMVRDILCAILSFAFGGTGHLKSWAANLTEQGFIAAGSVAQNAADMAEMTEQKLVQLVQSPDELTRMLASIFLGTHFCSNNPRLLSICAHYWIYIADKADSALDPARVVGNALGGALAPIVRERFAFRNPQRSVPILEESMRAMEPPWRYLSQLMEALGAVTGTGVSDDVRAILEKASATEQRWYGER